MTDIKAVVFDLYGTLLYRSAKTNPYTKLFTDIGLRTSEEFMRARRIALTEDFNDITSLVKRLKPEVQMDLLPYQQEVEKEIAAVMCYAETRKVLDELRKRDIPLGLLSNVASPYKKPFFDLGLHEYFAEVLFSCEIGLRKPNPFIYQKMIQMFHVQSAQILMIGDTIPTDIQGPQSVGMNALHLDRKNNTPDSINTLEEIFPYL